MMRSAGSTVRSLSRTWHQTGIKFAAAAAGTAVPQTEKRRATAEWGSSHLLGMVAAVSGFSMATAHADKTAEHDPSSSKALTLFQYEVCPWCNKVKAVLDYRNIPYRTVEVNPLMKTELKFSPDYKKVPIMITASGEQINDSNDIIQFLMSENTNPVKKGWFAGKVEQPTQVTEEEQRWRDWADDKLVKLVTVNIYRSWSEAYQAMDYVKYVQSFNSVHQTTAYWFGGAIMYLVGMRLVPKYGLEGKDLRMELQLAVDAFVDAVGQREFMGGKKPNLADLHVFGIVRAVSNTDTYDFIIHNTEIFPWWQRMVEEVGESSRIEDLEEVP